MSNKNPKSDLKKEDYNSNLANDLNEEEFDDINFYSVRGSVDLDNLQVHC